MHGRQKTGRVAPKDAVVMNNIICIRNEPRTIFFFTASRSSVLLLPSRMWMNAEENSHTITGITMDQTDMSCLSNWPCISSHTHVPDMSAFVGQRERERKFFDDDDDDDDACDGLQMSSNKMTKCRNMYDTSTHISSSLLSSPTNLNLIMNLCLVAAFFGSFVFGRGILFFWWMRDAVIGKW